MPRTTLTERQQRELDYYSEFSKRYPISKVNFAPVEGKEQRPWNSYWFVYQTVAEFFEGDHQRLLDFGCGRGTASMRFAKLGYETHGFDLCPDNLENCELLAEKYGYSSRCHFSIQLAEQLTYGDSMFDVVCGIDILHHIEIAPAIREVRRILKPGGLAVFREFVEVPIFDRVRNSRLVRKYFSKDMSIDEHRTHDERKLDKRDLRDIRDVFPALEVKRFCLISRLHRIVKKRRPGASRLERIDHALVRAIPFLSSLGGEAVLICRKEGVEQS